MIEHKSVLLSEVISILDPKNGVFLDLTLGFGGHTSSILEYGNASVIALDQDIESIEDCQKKLKHFGRIKMFHKNFKNFAEVVDSPVNGILLDLGVSTNQLLSPTRGLSFKNDGPLDMRMDQSHGITAADIVNSYSEKDLVKILEEYGEEYFANRIVKNIISSRPITTTKELENIIFHSYPAKKRYGHIHPATKSFQALRIAVNDELNCLLEVIPSLPNYLLPGGKIVIISFHSLEDRIVKQSFLKIAQNQSSFEILTKKPITAGPLELNANPRSRSAKLRAIRFN